MSLPVLYLMWVLHTNGYVMPRAPGGPALPHLILPMWIATMAYAVFQGLMYGTRSAIMMDVTNPRVAATQFAEVAGVRRERDFAGLLAVERE